jgi:hypothetical protein
MPLVGGLLISALQKAAQNRKPFGKFAALAAWAPAGLGL